MMNTIAITGHRPEQLVNVGWIEETLENIFQELKSDLLYQGMAAGVDLMSAKIAGKLKIPFIATRPWAGHPPRINDKEISDWALKNAKEIINVSPAQDYQGPFVYHMRNEFMVNHADILVAVWNGNKKGGTAACVRYARKQQKLIIQLNPITMEITRLTVLKVLEAPILF